MTLFLWSMTPDAAAEWSVAEPIPLSQAENRRADGYRFARDRARYVAARRFLRYVLGQHLRISPDAVTLRGQPGVKPTVVAPGAVSVPHFSLAYSGGHVLVGVAYQREIGVDIEVPRPLPDLEALAKVVFSQTDLRIWREAPDDERVAAFYRAWTRKEALGKARGTGISFGTAGLAVPLGPLPTGRWTWLAADHSGGPWLLSDLTVDDGSYASVVLEARAGDARAPAFIDVEGGEVPPACLSEGLIPPDGGRLCIRRCP